MRIKTGQLWAALFLILTTAPMFAQIATSSAGLQFLGNILVPNWTTSGATQANSDLFSFNPQTRVMYFADRVNHGVGVIDTRTNTLLGTIVLPPGCAAGASCPSGVLVAPDLQKLVVSDRLTTLYVYDLRVPGPPAAITVPNGCDEMDYDPLNHRVYLGNTSSPFFLTVIDLAGDRPNTVAGQIPLPGNPEQPRFNPVDGLIYLTLGDDEKVLVIDPKQGAAGAIVATFSAPNCAPHAIDIDPVTNVALLGCDGSNGQKLMDLGTGAILKTFPQVTGTDIGYFNPNTRRWYMGSARTVNSGVPCPKDSTNFYPVVGVFAAEPLILALSQGPNQLVGAQCSGRNARGLGVDTIQNNIYLWSRQYPVNAASADTGQPGVLAFNDPGPLALRILGQGQATLAPVASNTAKGTVNFTLSGRRMTVSASAQMLSDAAPRVLMVTTTIGNEVIDCTNADGGVAICTGTLLGDPLLGGVVDLASGGKLVAQGDITLSGGR